MHRRAGVWTVLVVCWFAAPIAAAAPSPDFARDVYPIFRRACFDCHGPEKQEGGLRLDRRDAALRGGDSGESFTAGKPDDSELLRRIALAKDEDGVMPARGDLLSPTEQQTIRRWIAAGADWPERLALARHWAYIPPVRPAAPDVKDRSWTMNAIDHFVLARLERESLRPAPEADRGALIRRLSLDLVGLPPTPAQVKAFINDQDPRAYERLVDRLLTSKQYGVRWATPWLDYARYADSHGFQRDDLRDIWAYRDWVVDALNADMPFDQFTVEQLAGDLLPDATEAQKIATGFNRNAPTNVEAGSDPEETRVNQVFDRVNTVGMIWLGSTMECCQCHDHKYDPFTQRDYYGLFAYFNNTALEADRQNPKVPGSIQFMGPAMTLADAELESQQKVLRGQLSAVNQRLAERAKALAAPDAAWEAGWTASLDQAPRQVALNIADFDSLGGSTHEVLADQSVLISGEVPDRDTYTIVAHTDLAGIRAIKLETLTDPSLPGSGPGRGDAERPNFVLQDFSLSVAPGGGEPHTVKFARATADFAQKTFDPAGAIDDDPRSGWAINPEFHEPHWAIFETAEPIGDANGATLTFRLEQNFGAGRSIGRLRLSALTGIAAEKSVPAEVVRALRAPVPDRTPAQTQAIAAYRTEQDAEHTRLSREKSRIETQLARVKPPSTLVMQELPDGRASTLFMRGDFRTPGEGVQPAVPAILASTTSQNAESSVEPARLALARWLASRDNPLAARATVNRFWSELFGHGIVTTPEDFGIKGDPPTHPELLDWLAVEFMDGGWSQKRLLKTIVMSATYRQSSKMTTALLAADEPNLLYARGPRFRLPAEAIRDNALAISGLLCVDQGGAPIRPYQPDGLWVKVGGQKYDYVVSPGEQQYRRGLYVVLKRAAPYPSFVNFDANARLACRVKRPRSNTPLQALTLLNDPVYVEAALAFARRIIADEPSSDLDSRIRYALLLAVARAPNAEEAAVLKKLWNAERDAAREHSGEARQLAGSAPLPPGVAAEEFAAWYAVAAAILNLDETITKE